MFEFLEHTADVQIHAWGATPQEAFRDAALGLSAYQCPDYAGLGTDASRTVAVAGRDPEHLLYLFLSEVLACFHLEYFLVRDVRFTQWHVPGEGDGDGAVADGTRPYRVTAELTGDFFRKGVHRAGTEVKAITYSNLQVNLDTPPHHLYIVVDI